MVFHPGQFIFLSLACGHKFLTDRLPKGSNVLEKLNREGSLSLCKTHKVSKKLLPLVTGDEFRDSLETCKVMGNTSYLNVNSNPQSSLANLPEIKNCFLFILFFWNLALLPSVSWLIPSPGHRPRPLSARGWCVGGTHEPEPDVTDRWRYLKEPAPPTPSRGPGRWSDSDVGTDGAYSPLDVQMA